MSDLGTYDAMSRRFGKQKAGHRHSYGANPEAFGLDRDESDRMNNAARELKRRNQNVNIEQRALAQLRGEHIDTHPS